MKPFEFNSAEKQGVYDAIFMRRDIRQEFISTPIPEEILFRLLNAAHHAGSVGFMQPWNFILIKDLEIRRQVESNFEIENKKAAQNYVGEQKELYQSFKLEGILKSPLNICVTCDPQRGGKHVLGRNTIRETDLFSTCCAIQNFWLAARAEGIGVGWVSILDNDKLRDILSIPKHIIPVAYLSVGYVSHFSDQPLLQKVGWRTRLPIEDLVFNNHWGNKNDNQTAERKTKT